MVKNNYAFQNNIILIRIPWNCQDNLTINDLLPECSQYTVNRYNIQKYYEQNGYKEDEYEEN